MSESDNYVVYQQMIYQGTVYSSVVRAAEVFRPAFTRHNCPAMVLVHNPSGDPTPLQAPVSA